MVREAPEHLLGRLRAIDSTAELLYWGPRLTDVEVQGKPLTIVVPVWLVGTVRPNGLRRKVGARLLHLEEQKGPRGNRDSWRYAKLLYQDFAPVAFYPVRDPSAAIVEDFRLRDWIFRNALEEEEKRSLLEMEGAPQLDMRIQKAVDKVQAEGPGLFRFAFKKQHSVMN